MRKGLLLLALLAAVGACGGEEQAHTPRTTQSTTAQTAGPELSYDEAIRNDLLRKDIVRVKGRAEILSATGWQRVQVRVYLPGTKPARWVQLVWSGDCTFSSETRVRNWRVSDIPDGTNAAISARTPINQTTCYVRADALFRGLPATGAGLTITLRR